MFRLPFRRPVKPVPLPPPTRLDPLVIAGREVPVTLRVSRRARRLALRLHPAGEGVELVLPEGASTAAALRFLRSRQDWIAAHLARQPDATAFAPGATIPVLGTARRLVLAPGGTRGRPFALGPDTITATGGIEAFSKRVHRGLRALALEKLTEKTRRLAAELDRAELGRPLGRVGIGDPRSRWGSCASSGNIRYSWRLVFAPEAVMDYVVAHEVAHLAEMNHSPRFWALVERLDPNAGAARAWLKRHGASLHGLG